MSYRNHKIIWDDGNLIFAIDDRRETVYGKFELVDSDSKNFRYMIEGINPLNVSNNLYFNKYKETNLISVTTERWQKLYKKVQQMSRKWKLEALGI